MENVNSEQTTLQAQPVETEKETGAIEETVSLRKFKDVNALLSAYGSLQAEFTKRCQRIKELEATLNGSDKEVPPITEEKQASPKKSDITEEEKQNVLMEYLQGVASRKQKAILLDGVGVGTKLPVSRTKTIAQAGALAQEFFNNKN